MPKKFVGEPFNVSLISGIEKVYASVCYVTVFCRSFSLAEPKTLQGNPSELCVKNFQLAKKFMDKKGEYQFFPLKIFRLSAEKFCR